MSTELTDESLLAIRALLSGSTPDPLKRVRYDHGGGRMYVEGDRDGRGRQLVLDVYEERDREFYFNAREAVGILISEVTRLRSGSAQWQPIETCPMGVDVLVAGGGCPYVHINNLRSFGGGIFDFAGLGDKQQPTHWMSLPVLPARANTS